MKRKVVQQGPATLMVSLPSKWVKENNVEKGADLDVSEEKGKLILTVENSQNALTTKDFHMNDTGILNEYFVNYFYQKGYDEVTIRYDDPKYTELIEKRAKEMIGFEVIEKGDRFTKLKMLMSIDQQEFNTVLKKLFQITLVIGDKIGEALEKENAGLFDEVKKDEKENNKYSDLCIRILYKNKYKYPENGFVLYSVIRELEQIGDLYKMLANTFAQTSLKTGELFELYQQVHDYFRLFYELYYTYDQERIKCFFDGKDLLLERCNDVAAHGKEERRIALLLISLMNAIFNLKGALFHKQL